MATHFNTQRIHLFRDLLLSDILIFVKIIKEKISYVLHFGMQVPKALVNDIN